MKRLGFHGRGSQTGEEQGRDCNPAYENNVIVLRDSEKAINGELNQVQLQLAAARLWIVRGEKIPILPSSHCTHTLTVQLHQSL